MDLRQLGSRIKQQREKLRLRQADIANALQISYQAVSKWERGENAPDISILVELSRLLGVSVDWLLGSHLPDSDTFVATVFCTSINGFAERSATMPPSSVASWANTIYYRVTETIKKFAGIPIKYIGDGFLGFFAGNHQEYRALQAAIEAKQAIDDGDFVITLHKGDIYLGTIGHPDYASTDIIGSTVNTTFLIMPWVSQNCQTGIGLTATVLNGIQKIPVTRCGEVIIPGVENAIEIFQPTES